MRVAGDFLMQNEAEHNLLLGILAQLRKSPMSDSYLASLEQDGQVIGCAFRTPPYKLGVTGMPAEAADALVEDVVSVYSDIPAVLGPGAVAERVANGIAQHYGRRCVERIRQRIYKLSQVVRPPNPPNGRLRLAQPADVDIIVAWLKDFGEETNHGPLDPETYARNHIANKTAFVWDDDGPKTTAFWAGITPHGVRIGFVFTPAPERAHGYASVCVADASQRALTTGYEFCCLYTDLGNPTSNRIYQRIGYTPVADAADWEIG